MTKGTFYYISQRMLIWIASAQYDNNFRWVCLVSGIGQNFIIDHRFCKTDWSSTHNLLVENICTLNLAFYQVLIRSSRSIRGNLENVFLIFSWKYMLWVLIKSALWRRFRWVPTTYVFTEKSEKYQYLLLTYLRLFYHFCFHTFIDHKSRMAQIDSFEFHFFITCR